ncbi:hypothetical protein FRC07_008334 [Ceratobasidium sp. 392]|nr:hypothetical protein FRC07_008334 [Ceratobasidium sp. 392]
MPGRYVVALQDLDQVLHRYRRVQNMLERLAVCQYLVTKSVVLTNQQLNANINMWMLVDEQATSQRLEKLNPSHAAWYSSAESEDIFRNECTPDTRVEVLERFHVWREDDESEKIYWLNGMAGTGKTTLAYTLCKQLENESRLAANFFCSRQLPSCREVKAILPTIAYQLANFSYPFRYALSQMLRRNPDVHTRRLPEQLTKLIYTPLLEVQDSLPCDLVIVIDGLDECESGRGVGEILDALLSCASDMPIKFFLTSRPEPDICSRMLGRDGDHGRFELHLHELDRAAVGEDIKKYLQTGLKRANLSARDLGILTERSGALFIYAATVVRYISAYDFTRSAGRLKQILGTAGAPNGNDKEINSLYTLILEEAFNDPGLDKQERAEMRLILDTIICAQEPMTVRMITSILGLEGEESVHVALGPLRSVLNVQKGEGITALHKSFPDYMVDPQRSQGFCCDTGKHHAILAQRCFDLIKMPDPPFNICRLESSYTLDQDVLNLGARIERYIPGELLYACRYWGAHFQPTKSHILRKELHNFLSTRLLLWMEVMNLKLDLFSRGASTLFQVKDWVNRDEYSAEVQDLAKDAYDFVNTYTSSPASLSTPHIYISALAFWSKLRPVSKCYSDSIQDPIIFTAQGIQDLNPKPQVIYGIKSGVTCTTFSPNLAFVFSGFNDGMVCELDAYYGEEIATLPTGHMKTVYSIMYASNGRRIVTGSEDGTVIVWSTEIYQMVGDPLRGHAGAVYSVSYSPDCDSVASGSHDTTVRIWSFQADRTVSKSFDGHTGSINAVTYSPDSRYIASGSSDKTVRIWSIDTCQIVGKPLNGHSEVIFSIVYSEDGDCILSGSIDGTICVWDAGTGQLLATPLLGHNDAIFSTILLPSGRKYLSRHNENAINVWDVSKKVVSPADDDFTYVHPLSDEMKPAHGAPLVRRIAYPRFDNALGLGHCSAFDDEGWLVVGSDRLVWVPPNIRDFMWHPQGGIMVSSQVLANVSVGDRWHHCYHPVSARSNSPARPPMALCDTHDLFRAQGLKGLFFDKNDRRKYQKQGQGFRH